MHANQKRHTILKVSFSLAILLLIALIIVYFSLLSNKKPIDPQSSNSPAKELTQTEKSYACVDALPDTVLLGQKLMVATYNTQIDAVQKVTTAHYLNGVIIMDEVSEETIRRIYSNATISPTIATDQEGGTVQRFTSEGDVPGAEQVVASLTPGQAYATYLKDAIFLKNIGITTNFAPVADVLSIKPSPLPGRMYSSDPTTVSTYAAQFIKASQRAGITPVIKHFPGLGSASGNTDLEVATTDPLELLKGRDLAPYTSLAHLKPDVMVSSAIIPGLSSGQPAIWSPETIALLRSYGYKDSVVYTDSLTAQAVPGTLDLAALKAWQAGVDVAVVVQTKEQLPELNTDVTAIIDASKTALQSGELSRDAVVQSVLRILARKGIDPCSLADINVVQ